MDSIHGSTEDSRARPPGRQSSRRQALLRRSTKGPLESGDGDDPLLSSITSTEELETVHHAQDDTPILHPQVLSRPQSISQSTPNPETTTSAIPVADRPLKNLSFLLKPSNFLSIDQQDIPPPFRTTAPNPPSQPLSSLLSSGHFLSAATLAASHLTSEPDPTNHHRIFSLLYVRLACLTLVGLEAQAAQESKCLQDLNAPFYRDRSASGAATHLVPWDLRVLAVRLQAIGFGDWRRGIMTYYDLAREARYEARRTADEQRELWTTRLDDLGIRVANALVEIGDMDGAVRHLQALAEASGQQQVFRTRLALAFLQSGDVEAARKCLLQSPADDDGAARTDGAVETDPWQAIIEALCSMADGLYHEAIKLWQAMAKSSPSPPIHAIITHNLALCHIYTCEAVKAREILEGLIDSHGNIGDITINLATVYELCSEKGSEMKLRLAERVAAMEGTDVGWDKLNVDFKL